MILLATFVLIVLLVVQFIKNERARPQPQRKESPMKIEIYEDKAGEYRWRLKARNGRIIAIPGEGYTRKRDCYRAVCVLFPAIRESLSIPIKDLTKRKKQ